MPCTSLRRSGRTVNLPTRFRCPSPSPQSPRVEKRRSPRSLRITRTKVVKVITKTRSSVRYISNDAEPRVRASRCVEDFASDSDEEGEEGETFCEEHIHLSADEFEYNTFDALDRRVSLDSRLDSGNENYDRDGFVVDDDSEDDVSDVDSEITIGDWDDDVSDADSDTTVTQELVDEQCNLSISCVSVTGRKDSATSTKSSDSGLFVRNPNEKPSSCSQCPMYLSRSTFQVLAKDVDPADVAEEISDVTCRFSRRCNNHSSPLRLVLTSAVLGGGEVCDAVQRAVK